jgi:hypothetical protein
MTLADRLIDQLALPDLRLQCMAFIVGVVKCGPYLGKTVTGDSVSDDVQVSRASSVKNTAGVSEPTC